MTVPAANHERVTVGDTTTTVVGSDKKAPAGAVGVCGLCLSPGPLLLSHVIPKWSARWAKAEGRPIGVYPSIGVETAIDDFPKHYLLCERCEQYLGVAEQYLSRIAKGTKADLKSVSIDLEYSDQVTTLRNVNGALVFRAVSANLLRAHLAKSHLFRDAKLSRKEAARLRNAILADVYPPGEMSLFANKWVNTTVSGANPKSLMIPLFRRGEGGILFDVFMGGLSWTFFFGATNIFRRSLKGVPIWPNYSLVVGQPWAIVSGEWTSHRFIDSPSRAIIDRGWTSLRATDPCPCGLEGVSFGECCWGRWLDPGIAG